MLKLIVVGMNHKTAPLETREKMALSPDDAARVLQEASTHPGLETALILSTCHRLELYAIPSERGNLPHDLLGLLSTVRPEVFDIPQECWYHHRNEAALRHLFQVSAGMDSMMLGEPQVLGQLKDAYQQYCDCCEPHPLFNKLFHLAFRCGKRVRTETQLGEGAVSLAHAAVDFAAQRLGGLKDKSALLVGAGETGELVARHLVEHSIQKLKITNRTPERAEALAKQLSCEVIPFTNISDALAYCNLAVFCTESPACLVHSEMLRNLPSHSQETPLLLIDLGIPRNCHPDCAEVPGVQLFHLDDLKQEAEMNLARRMSEIPKAEAIVEEMLGRFLEWHRNLKVEPLIRALMEKAEQVRSQEVDKNRKRFEEASWQDLDSLTRAIIKKVLHAPLEKLKEYDGDMRHGISRIDAFRELFKLDENATKDDPSTGNPQ